MLCVFWKATWKQICSHSIDHHPSILDSSSCFKTRFRCGPGSIALSSLLGCVSAQGQLLARSVSFDSLPLACEHCEFQDWVWPVHLWVNTPYWRSLRLRWLEYTWIYVCVITFAFAYICWGLVFKIFILKWFLCGSVHWLFQGSRMIQQPHFWGTYPKKMKSLSQRDTCGPHVYQHYLQ